MAEKTSAGAGAEHRLTRSIKLAEAVGAGRLKSPPSKLAARLDDIERSH